MTRTRPGSAAKRPAPTSECPECGRFFTRAGLAIHRRFAHGAGVALQTGYVCKCCGERFPTPEDMGRHMGVRD